MTEVISESMMPPGAYLCEHCDADALLDGGTLADVLQRRPNMVTLLTIRHAEWCPTLRAYNRAGRRLKGRRS